MLMLIIPSLIIQSSFAPIILHFFFVGINSLVFGVDGGDSDKIQMSLSAFLVDKRMVNGGYF